MPMVSGREDAEHQKHRRWSASAACAVSRLHHRDSTFPEETGGKVGPESVQPPDEKRKWRRRAVRIGVPAITDGNPEGSPTDATGQDANRAIIRPCRCCASRYPRETRPSHKGFRASTRSRAAASPQVRVRCCTMSARKSQRTSGCWVPMIRCRSRATGASGWLSRSSSSARRAASPPDGGRRAGRSPPRTAETLSMKALTHCMSNHRLVGLAGTTLPTLSIFHRLRFVSMDGRRANERNAAPASGSG